MRKCKKEKINEIEVLYIYLLVLFSLGHVIVLVAINLYFILSISHVSIFHSSLNGRDHFNTKSKRLMTKLTHKMDKIGLCPFRAK